MKISKNFFAYLLVVVSVLSAKLTFAEDDCQPGFESKNAPKVLESKTSGKTPAINLSRDWDKLTPYEAAFEMFQDLAGSKEQAKELFDEVLLKVRKKMHSKKTMSPWVEIAQSISAVKRSYEKPLSQLRSAQVKQIRIGILQAAVKVPDIRQDIMVKLSNELFKEFKTTLKRPNLKKVINQLQYNLTLEEFAMVLNLKPNEQQVGMTSVEVLENTVFTEMRKLKEDGFDSIKQSLIVAYRTRASKYRRTLTLNQFYHGVLEKFPELRDSGFNLADLSYLVGDGFISEYSDDNVKQTKIKGATEHKTFEFALFEGLKDVYAQTRRLYPAQFERVIDLYQFDTKYHEQILNAWKNHKRMIVTWAAPRVEVDKDLFDSMMRYAEEQDAFVVVIPEAGQPMELDPLLYKHPRIFIALDAIEFSPWLKLNALMPPGKRIDPNSNLRAPGRGGDRGVTHILGHPQMRDEIMSTADNDTHTHRVMTSGAITKPWYNSKFVIGHVTDQQARDVHLNGFLVVEKDKANSGIDGLGTANTVHTRHVEFIPETKSFIDMGKQYSAKGSKNIKPKVMVPGDDHVGVEHIEFAREKLKIIKKYLPSIYVTHDVFDGTSISHWDAENPLEMAKKAMNGELSLTEELTKVVHFFNALIDANPNMQIVVDVANHNEWLVRMLKEMHKPGQRQPINDPLAAELWSAWLNHGIHPLNYFLQERANVILQNADRSRITSHVPIITDPTKISFAGKSMKVGPDHRLVEIGEHGHRTGGLSKGALTLRMSAGRAYNSIVFGHTHSSGRNFRAVNVGASMGAGDYVVGGPSSVDMAFAFIYDDGTIQLHHFDAKSLTFALEEDEAAPAKSYIYRNPDNGVIYPRVIELEDRLKNLDTLDQWRTLSDRNNSDKPEVYKAPPAPMDSN